jgi:hypothetical protein
MLRWQAVFTEAKAERRNTLRASDTFEEVLMDAVSQLNQKLIRQKGHISPPAMVSRPARHRRPIPGGCASQRTALLPSSHRPFLLPTFIRRISIPDGREWPRMST